MKWYRLLWMIVLYAAAVTCSAAPDICVSMAKYNDNYLTTLRNNLADQAQTHHLLTFFRDSQNSSEFEKENILAFLNQNCPLIVINLVDIDQAKALLDLIPSTTPVIFLNREPEIELPAHAYYVGNDEYRAGKIQISHLMSISASKLHLGILMGDPHSGATKRRTSAITDFITAYPSVRITISAYAGFSRTEAEQQVTYWLSQKLPLDAILANNDEMALGALNAIKKANVSLKTINVLGIDGTIDALDAIRRGEMTASVFQDAEGQASKTVELASLLQAHQPIQTQKFYVPTELITLKNYQNYIR